VGGSQGLVKRQVLKAVQGIVMDEIANRGLRRQDMRQVIDPGGQLLADG
jgi:hypothetical protein